jgi:serine/threonine-protein kinase
MEDPEPIERVARGVPAAFGAIIRKLMAKDPAERYLTCIELQADLTRWTDPRRVRALLGSEADAVHSFQPPPPILAEEDLRLLGPDLDGPSLLSLRDLGDAEPSAAPLHRPPPPPLTARFRPRSPAKETEGDSRWLLHFSLIALAVGLVAILAIAVFLNS